MNGQEIEPIKAIQETGQAVSTTFSKVTAVFAGIPSGVKSAIVVILCFGLAYGGGYITGCQCNKPGEGGIVDIEPSGKPQTTENETPLPQYKKQIGIAVEQTKKQNEIKVTAKTDTLTTTQNFQLKIVCPAPKWTVSGALFLFGYYNPIIKAFDVGPGLELGFRKHFGEHFSMGPDVGYGYGLVNKTQLVTVKARFNYTW